MTERLLPGQLAELIRASGETLVREALALTPAVATFHPEPGAWCAHEVLGHMIEAERRGFLGRVRQLLAEENPRLESWDQEEVARSRNDCARALTDLVKEFRLLRSESVAQVFRLPEEEMARGGEHPLVGRLTVGDVVQEWVYHDRDHIRQLYANVQTYVFQHMGGTQRFYQS
ncbi:MAG TPA: DinB family protein [Chloroflexota bacterium]|nr:DinB family protein [Chloroflexota bacterium]